ncbi:MAG TPA: carboxypeptidase regulatory-like domain-containing protein [Planctomycetota bacterium]|nr:carboxypeptidase regulatory-like domain-containing protein [Planctomycetota bacterium]
MPRLLAIVTALLLLLAAVWLLRSCQETTLLNPGPPPAGGSGADVDPATAAVATAGASEAADKPIRREVAPAADGPVFTVNGMVLADRKAPVAGARVLAYRGEADDRGGITPMDMSRGGNPGLSFQLTGEPIASAVVDVAGNFTLRADGAHLRITLEHDLYALPLPEVVHVPQQSKQASLVLTPMLGGMLRGRLLGERKAHVTQVRLFLEPDPMSVMGDSRALLGAILASTLPGAKPEADGTFVFRGVMSGAAITLTVAGDAVTARTTQPALEPAEVRDVVVAVNAGASLDVLVVDAAGAPIADASVSARAGDHSPMIGQLMAARGRTGPDGICRLRGLRTDRTTVEATAKARLTATATVDLQAGEPRQVRLELGEGGKVTGIVTTDGGAPVADARVAHFPSGDIPLLGDIASQLGAEQMADVARSGVHTDAEGRFELTGLADEGTFVVVAAHPDHAAGQTKGVRMGDRDVKVTLQPLGGLRGRVIAAEDQKPLPSFTVTLLRTSFLVLRTPVRQQVFDAAADGVFELGRIAPGDYTLQVKGEGRSEVEQTVTIAAGTTDAGTLEVSRAAAITGAVRDEQGQPVRGALVRKRQGAMGDNPMMALFGGGPPGAYTDGEGRFRLEPLAPGRLQLLATAGDFASGRSERLKVEAGQVLEGIVITLDHGGSIHGKLLVGAGQQTDEFLVTVQEQVTQSSRGATPAPDGTFRFENLDPGQHTVQAMPAGLMRSLGGNEWKPGQSMRFGEIFQKITDQVVSQRCAVRAGETTEVTLDASEVATGSRWIVRVEVGGQLFDNGLIEAIAIEDGRMRAAMLFNGSASFAGIRPGPHRLQVRGGMTMTPIGPPQDVAFPQDTTEHRTTLSLPAGELRGRVVDAATGQPLRTAVVRLLHEGHAERDDSLGMALTDAAGEFRFTGLGEGTYGLIAADPLHPGPESAASRRAGIRVVPGTPGEVVELRAHPSAAASVLVTTSGGQPVAGATVLCVDAEGHPLGAPGLATTGPDGRAWFGGMPRGAARIVGRAAGFGPGASPLLELDPDRAQEFALSLPTGTRTALQAVDAAGRTLRGATVTARWNDTPWLPSFLLVEATRADGVLELGRLGRGNWEFRVSHPGVGTLTHRRTIGNEAAVTIVVAPQ